MAARRCKIGCESWPDDPLFGTCVYCHEPTRREHSIEPTISREDARAVRLHDLFDQFYELRCKRLGIPAEGPLK